MEKINRLIVVGGNAAGMAAATNARRRRPDLDITLIEKGRRIAMATCSIPAYLENRIESISSLENLTPSAAADKYKLNVMTAHEAIAIEPRSHRLVVRNADTDQTFDLPYDRLILSTGARAIHPDWPNVHAKGIFTLRNLDDAFGLRSHIESRKPKRVVVVGAGTIAQVCASALRKLGPEVVMIGPEKRLMEYLEEPISSHISKTLETGNISLYFDHNIVGFKVTPEGEVSAVETTQREIVCQAVLLAIGVLPNTDLARSADLALGTQGTIRIDRHLMTSRQNIYACGDCTHTVLNITRKPIYWPLATTASRQGRQAGESAVGNQGEDPGTLATRLWTCFDLVIGRVGLSSAQAAGSGFKSQITTIEAASKPGFYGGHRITLVIISDSETGRVLGAQIAGREGVHARLNSMAAAISGKLTLKELENLDFGYTAELSGLWDPIQIAARVGRRQ